MGTAALKLKILPKSLDINLDEIKGVAEKKITELGAKNISFEEEPIAFGLKAIILTTAWPEEVDTDKAENSLSEIKGVSSVQIIDYRRAFG